MSYNFENHIGHWKRRIHPLCVWTVLAHGPGCWPIGTRDSVWPVGGGDGRWWWWGKWGETALGFGTSRVNSPRSCCLLPSFAFLCGHSWNPSERTSVVVVVVVPCRPFFLSLSLGLNPAALSVLNFLEGVDKWTLWTCVDPSERETVKKKRRERDREEEEKRER
jgi:hypothetical protein